MCTVNNLQTTIPVFLLGSARSGTTWLANLLGSHPDIASIACVEHHGIHESHIFDHTRYCFSEKLGCSEFIEKYKEEDYFKLLRVGGENICANHSTKESVFFWFRQLMEEFGQRHAAIYWLEKTPKHTIYYDEIIYEFPEAIFITINREFRNTLLSNLTKYARNDISRYRQIAEKVFRYELDRRALRRLDKVAKARVINVRYEDLLSDTAEQIQRIEKYLGIAEITLKSQYSADSSYRRKKQQYYMSSADWLMAYVMRIAVAAMPFRVGRAIRIRRDKLSASQFPIFARIQDIQSGRETKNIDEKP